MKIQNKVNKICLKNWVNFLSNNNLKIRNLKLNMLENSQFVENIYLK